MEGGVPDDLDVLRALGTCGARVLLIGRRALVALGLPVVTADYDVWVHIDDVELLNRGFEALDFVASVAPAEARQRGWYVLEDGEHVDVVVARAKSSPDGTLLDFESAWSRRQALEVASGIEVFLPSIDDLIVTKQWGGAGA